MHRGNKRAQADSYLNSKRGIYNSAVTLIVENMKWLWIKASRNKYFCNIFYLDSTKHRMNLSFILTIVSFYPAVVFIWLFPLVNYNRKVKINSLFLVNYFYMITATADIMFLLQLNMYNRVFTHYVQFC